MTGFRIKRCAHLQRRCERERRWDKGLPFRLTAVNCGRSARSMKRHPGNCCGRKMKKKKSGLIRFWGFAVIYFFLIFPFLALAFLYSLLQTPERNIETKTRDFSYRIVDTPETYWTVLIYFRLPVPDLGLSTQRQSGSTLTVMTFIFHCIDTTFPIIFPS